MVGRLLDTIDQKSYQPTIYQLLKISQVACLVDLLVAADAVVVMMVAVALGEEEEELKRAADELIAVVQSVEGASQLVAVVFTVASLYGHWEAQLSKNSTACC